MNSKVAIYEKIFPPKLSAKARGTYLRIIDGAIQCYSRYGIDNTTFELIAQESKISRPLVLRYFKNYDGLFEASVKVVRAFYQDLLVEAFADKSTPEAQLDAFMRVSTEAVRQHPTYMQLWLFFFYQCSRSPKHRKLNTEFVEMGHARIAALLQQLAPNEAPRTIRERAKFLQVFLTGLIVQVATDEWGGALKEVVAAAPEWAGTLAAGHWDFRKS